MIRWRMSRRIAPSANFRNPLGLLRRMLLSGQAAAWSALMHEGLRLLTKPLDHVLQRREQELFQRHLPNDFPILLVIGAPRSGTTLVSQTMARYLNVSYFTNLTSLFPLSPVTATRMFGRRHSRPSGSFQNFYGQTAGLYGPHDGFFLWNRWLGEDRYSPRTDLTPDAVAAMRHFFDVWCATFAQPLLNKNNRNTSCVSLLARALPRARFIVVRRNPFRVAQSLVQARQQVQGDKRFGWGLRASERSESGDPLGYIDDVCRQVLQIDEQLDEQLRQVSRQRVIEITYEGFCADPAGALRAISGSVDGVSLETSLMSAELRPFRVSTGVPLTDAERDRLLWRLHAAGRTGPSMVQTLPSRR